MSHKPKELRSRGIVTAYINDLEDKGLKKSNKRPVSEVNEGVPLRVTGSSGLPGTAWGGGSPLSLSLKPLSTSTLVVTPLQSLRR